MELILSQAYLKNLEKQQLKNYLTKAERIKRVSNTNNCCNCDEQSFCKFKDVYYCENDVKEPINNYILNLDCVKSIRKKIIDQEVTLVDNNLYECSKCNEIAEYEYENNYYCEEDLNKILNEDIKEEVE